MALDIDIEAGTETVRDEAESGVRAALGPRIDQGAWLLSVRRMPEPRAVLVELTNRDGLTRHWVFDPTDPISSIIRDDLRPQIQEGTHGEP